MAERELKKLKCYACNGEVCQIGSSQYKVWTIEYKADFGESYISSDAPLDVSRHYSDPDTSYRKGMDHSFFCDLVKFLIRREKEMSNHLQGSFKYKFVEGKGIEVSGLDSKGEKKMLFYLRSDQFGFSAPVNEKCYPYDLYIKKCKNNKEVIKQVIEWISMSRTIGGSFLWPELFHKNYNPQRGGKITSNRQYYIQDRVDLTLWEIKDWYSKHNSGKAILERQSILERCSENKPDIEQWLLHFGNFETYAEYFMLDKSQFVDKSYNPINIIPDEADVPVRGANGKNPEPVITEFMSLDSLKKMLETLNNKIVKRSIEMTKIIDKENQCS